MIFIAHRGNVTGPNKARENSPDYLLEAINLGFHVEVDVWVINDEIFLGHDGPEHIADIAFLEKIGNHSWFHAKNSDALFMLMENELRCFSHDQDPYTITSNGYIWAYPGQKLNERSICVLPERYPERDDWKTCAGICTDYTAEYFCMVNQNRNKN